jgi:putative ribosome biogenesis GTPase RsgA
VVEPGCVVQKAVSDGKISAKRFENYQKLIKEAASPTCKSQ